MRLRLATCVAFLSGLVALGYEILWARRLSDIIGATAFASSLVVGVFFLALAAGAIWLGPRAARHRSPWQLYGWLELGILLGILPSFFGERLSGVLAHGLGPLLLHPQGGLVVKTALAILFVAPPSFLMGGTLPALGQAVVDTGRLGREGNVLYGINTLGGATGIVLTTFFIVPALGMHLAFLVLMATSLGLAVVALHVGARAAGRTPREPRQKAKVRDRSTKERRTHPARHERNGASDDSHTTPAMRAWLAMAALSGFIVLGLEILALHLFSQVLHNSTYTFASVLVVVIAALTVGALVTQRWDLDAPAAWSRLGIVLALATCVLAAMPRLFFVLTDDMSPFGGGRGGFAFYILRILGNATIVLGPAFVLAGWVFALVLAGAGSAGIGKTGALWGRLLGVNAAGALLGLLLANHVAMPLLGLWGSLLAWCLLMAVAALFVVRKVLSSSFRRLAFAMLAAVCLILLLTRPWSLPVAHLDPGERIVDWHAGPDGVSAVLDQGPDRRIKWNNTYSLGSSANAAQQARLGYLPLLLHPDPRRVAFIGSATGITTSSALRDPAVTSVTAVELSALTMRLACEHFAPWNENLCAHAHTRTVIEDGRLFFRATRDSFDVVVGDLFVPWRSGVANLYTQEHFETVRSRLRPGGIFAQWLPLFQMDARSFWGIAATFCSVFPNAWLAIADFQPNNPGVALIGWRGEGGPDAKILARRCGTLGSLPALREPMLRDPAGVAMFLVGPMAPALPPQVELMTVDRPWLADHAPRVQRDSPPRFFVGADLVMTLQRIARNVPEGPLRPFVLLGQEIYAFSHVMEREDPQRATAWYEQHVHVPLPPQVFRVPQAMHMSWPFTQQVGVFLLRRAQAEGRTGSP